MTRSNVGTPAPAMTVTSFAVLGPPAIDERIMYELAQQMERSFSYLWPRGERRIYDGPKRRAAARYGTSRKEVVGRRPRTCWQITDAGREALRSWLAQPLTSPPVVEFEGMVKIFVSENGGKLDLLASLKAIRDTDNRGAAARKTSLAYFQDHAG